MPDYEIQRSAKLSHILAQYNSAVLIDPTHAIVAHHGTSADGFIQTFSWDANFDNLAVVNTLEHDVTDITYSSLVKVTATLYALVYSDVNGDGIVKTFTIDGSFIITQVDSFEFDTVDGIWGSMVLISPTRLLCAYGGPDGDGFLKSFSFDAGTGANIALVDTLEHDTTGPVTHNSLELINDTHAALAYHGVSGDGILKTFSFTTSGGSIAQVDSFIFDAAGANWNSLVLIDELHLALAYTRPANFGRMKTFSIDSSANNIAQIADFEYEAVNGNGNSLVLIDTDATGSRFILSFNRGLDAHLETFSIDSAFDNIASISKWVHDPGNGNAFNSLIKIDLAHYFLAYSDVAQTGQVRTVPVLAIVPGAVDTGNAGMIIF